MQKWDYRVLVYREEGGKWSWKDTSALKAEEVRLKELGQEGWELVNVAPYEGQFNTKSYSFYLKRPIE